LCQFVIVEEYSNMDREAGMDILSRGAWLRETPNEFRTAILSRCRWQCLEAGALVQAGGEDGDEMSGLAHGIIKLRTVLGPADTPIMHFARPVFWLGYSRIVVHHRPHRVEATAKTTIWLARVSLTAVRTLLSEQPEWWQFFLQPSFFYGDIALNVAADLLISNSERRCAAVLLRLSGRRFIDSEDPDPADILVTQDELASAANLSRSSVRTMLQKLAARQLIEQGYRGIVVRNPAALRAFVDQ
jgi:CRP/FNR family cyclic AMP-dependent transcriptional regulator